MAILSSPIRRDIPAANHEGSGTYRSWSKCQWTREIWMCRALVAMPQPLSLRYWANAFCCCLFGEFSLLTQFCLISWKNFTLKIFLFLVIIRSRSIIICQASNPNGWNVLSHQPTVHLYFMTLKPVGKNLRFSKNKITNCFESFFY